MTQSLDVPKRGKPCGSAKADRPPLAVYNLAVGGAATYTVGLSSVLAHNKECKTPQQRLLERTIGRSSRSVDKVEKLRSDALLLRNSSNYRDRQRALRADRSATGSPNFAYYFEGDVPYDGALDAPALSKTPTQAATPGMLHTAADLGGELEVKLRTARVKRDAETGNPVIILNRGNPQTMREVPVEVKFSKSGKLVTPVYKDPSTGRTVSEPDWALEPGYEPTRNNHLVRFDEHGDLVKYDDRLERGFDVVSEEWVAEVKEVDGDAVLRDISFNSDDPFSNAERAREALKKTLLKNSENKGTQLEAVSMLAADKGRHGLPIDEPERNVLFRIYADTECVNPALQSEFRKLIEEYVDKDLRLPLDRYKLEVLPPPS